MLVYLCINTGMYTYDDDDDDGLNVAFCSTEANCSFGQTNAILQSLAAKTGETGQTSRSQWKQVQFLM